MWFREGVLGSLVSFRVAFPVTANLFQRDDELRVMPVRRRACARIWFRRVLHANADDSGTVSALWHHGQLLEYDRWRLGKSTHLSTRAESPEILFAVIPFHPVWAVHLCQCKQSYCRAVCAEYQVCHQRHSATPLLWQRQADR